jgi:hypothetical protein
MPRIKLTKNAIDSLPTPKSDVIYWDVAAPGFGVKITPKDRKVFVVPSTAPAAPARSCGNTLSDHTGALPFIRPAWRHRKCSRRRARSGRRETRAKRRIVADRVEDLLEAFVAQRLSQNRSAAEVSRQLRREVGKPWGDTWFEAVSNGASAGWHQIGGSNTTYSVPVTVGPPALT